MKQAGSEALADRACRSEKSACSAGEENRTWHAPSKHMQPRAASSAASSASASASASSSSSSSSSHCLRKQSCVALHFGCCERGFICVYTIQKPLSCANLQDGADALHHAGKPALVAALNRQVVPQQHLESQRVEVAKRAHFSPHTHTVYSQTAGRTRRK
eukprot:1796649-Amphidinium_carterae.1